MLAISRVVYALYCFHLLSDVKAIPEKLDKRYKAPDAITVSNNKAVLMRPSNDILSLDAFCKFMYRPWWKVVKDLRAKVHQDMLATPQLYEDSPIPLHYTDYSYEDVPLQGIWATAHPASLTSGYRYGLASCAGSCQEIRSTMEILATAIIDQKPERRVRSDVSMPCPSNYKSQTTRTFSRRQFGSPAQESTALSILSTSRDDRLVQYIAQPLTNPEIVGDLSLMVDGCECILLTPEELVQKERMLEDARNVQVRRAAIRKIRPPKPSSRRKKARADDENGAGSSQLVHQEPEYDDRPPSIDSASFSLDEALRQDIRCFDFDFPDIQVGLTPRPRPLIPSDQYQVPESPSISSYITATLEALTNQQTFMHDTNGAGPSGTKDPGKGH